MRWPRGVRARLAGALVLLVAVTAVALGVTVFVEARLRQQALADAAAQATFDLTVTVPGRQLPDEPTIDDVIWSGLTDRSGGGTSIGHRPGGRRDRQVERRPVGPAGATAGRRPGPGRSGCEPAYAWLDVAGRPSLVVGGLVLGGDLAVYFVRDVAEIDAAVGQLRAVLLGGTVVLVVVALLLARSLARDPLADRGSGPDRRAHRARRPARPGIRSVPTTSSGPGQTGSTG